LKQHNFILKKLEVGLVVYVVKVVAVMLPGAVARMWVLHKLFGL
jgi:hypothetical protein